MNFNSQERVASQIIKTWFRYLTTVGQATGIQVTIRKNALTLMNEAFGTACAGTSEKLTTQHQLQLGSQSKMVTAALIHQLADKGQLSLNDPITKYLESVTYHPDQRAKDITIKDLLSHRSGFMRDGASAPFWEGEKPFPTKEEICAKLRLCEIVYEPNTVTKYSNFGYALLGQIIEAVTGKPYTKVVQARFNADLLDSGFWNTPDDETKNPFARGHVAGLGLEGAQPVVHIPANGFSAACGLCSDTAFMSGFFHDYLFGDRILPRAVQKEILGTFWPVKNLKNREMGLGLDRREIDGRRYVGYAGSYIGFGSMTAKAEDLPYIISVSLNDLNSAVPLVSGITNVFDYIGRVVSKSEAAHATVSEPLLSHWGDVVFVVLPSKAWEIPLFGEMKQENIKAYRKIESGYVSEEKNGIQAIGEPITFEKQDGKIVAASLRGQRMVSVAEHRGRLRRILYKPQAPA